MMAYGQYLVGADTADSSPARLIPNLEQAWPVFSTLSINAPNW